LEYIALNNSLQRGVISPVYLFYGEETYLRNQYLERFKALIPEEYRDFNLDIVDGRETGIGAVLSIAATLPFFSDKRLVIVKHADFFKARRKAKKGMVSEADEQDSGEGDREQEAERGAALLEYLDNPLESTCLIFCAESIDKKRSIYKRIEQVGQVVEFAPLKNRDLSQWIERMAGKVGKSIEQAAVAGLVTAVGNNLQQLSTELEKLACHTRTGVITAADVDLMVSKTAELSIFELVDAVGERKYQKALRMAREMVFLGEPVIRILFMIARQFRLLLRARSFCDGGASDRQAAAELQIHPYVAQKCVRQARNFTMSELQLAMEKILAADYDIKTGRQEAMQFFH